MPARPLSTQLLILPCRTPLLLATSRHSLPKTGKDSAITSLGHTLRVCNFKTAYRIRQWIPAKLATRLPHSTITALRREILRDFPPRCWEPTWKTRPIDGWQSTRSRLVRWPWISKRNRKRRPLTELLELRIQFTSCSGPMNDISNWSARVSLAVMVDHFLWDPPHQ